MMSETKPPNKSKSKKKKPKAVVPIAKAQGGSVIDCPLPIPNAVKLPQNKNELTFINEVQVTMADPDEVRKASQAKLKQANGDKKKQNKWDDKGNVVNLKPDAPDAEPPLLSFSRSGGMELKNLPEITVSPTVQSKVEAPVPNSTPNEGPEKDPGSTNTTKKKKKKKKKNKSETQASSTPSDNNEKKSGDSDSAPTYVKVPTSDDNFVLVVSHSSFSNSGNTPAADSSVEVSDQSSSINYAIKASQPPETSNGVVAQAGSEPAVDKTVKTHPFVTLTPIYPDVAQTGVEPEKVPAGEQNTATGKKEKKKNKKLESKAEKTELTVKPQPEKTEKAPNVQKDAKMAQDSQKAVSVPEGSKAKSVKQKSAPNKQKKAVNQSFVSHLQQYKTLGALSKHLETKSSIHPRVVAVAAQLANGIINGSTARCVAMLGALTEVIKDYVTPPNKELSRELGAKLKECVNYILKTRPLSVSMGNAIKVITHYITQIPEGISDDEAKEILCSQIAKFVDEEICLARKAISQCTTEIIVDGDVILTFAYSSLVRDFLCQAFAQKKSFKVIVVDSRPQMEGWQLLQKLLKEGVSCSYTLTDGVSYVLDEVTKVFIGAQAFQGNRYVESPCGCSEIALLCSSRDVPVYVCCERYKFVERAHTDSLVHNELGDPESFFNTSPSESGTLENWKDLEKLQLLNLLHDITPPHLISAVITEKSVIRPFTSLAPVASHS